MSYPEHKKMTASVTENIGTILEFLEFLNSKDISLEAWSDDLHESLLCLQTPEYLALEFFGIDKEKLDKEEKQMLKELGS